MFSGNVLLCLKFEQQWLWRHHRDAGQKKMNTVISNNWMFMFVWSSNINVYSSIEYWNTQSGLNGPGPVFCPKHDVKRYPSGVRLNNQKVFCVPGPRTNHFEQFYFCHSINNSSNTITLCLWCAVINTAQ